MTRIRIRSFRCALPALIVMLALSACARTTSTVLKTYPARAADAPIEVLSDFPTDRAYEEIALLDAMGQQHTFADRSTDGVIEQLKKEARSVGADAIVVRSTEGGSYNWGQGGWNRARADAVAIKF